VSDAQAIWLLVTESVRRAGERCKVVAVRLGAEMPLEYRWFHRFEPIGEPVRVSLGHGDMYVMSEKAAGKDWKKSSHVTLRHAAGCKSFRKHKSDGKPNKDGPGDAW
jgi:hypothetical protein